MDSSDKKDRKRKLDDSWIGILVIAISLLYIGELFSTLLVMLLAFILNIPDKYEIFLMYLATFGSIIAVVRYIKKHKEDNFMLKKLKFKMSHFLMGLAIGFTLNIICAFSAMLHKDLVITLSNAHVIGLIIGFIFVIIQSTSEEILCRLFVYEKLKKKYKSPLVWILVNSIFFGLLHIGNDGVTVLAIIDICIYGIFMSLLVYYFDSIWLVSAIHASWNFTQNFLLGLPNSGTVSEYSLYEIVKSNNSFFYNTNFGVEETWFCVILLSVLIIFIYLLCHKKK